MNWNEIVDRVTPYIVKIETPTGHGTGYLSHYNINNVFCGIATAHHVVSDTDEWQQPMRLRHAVSGETAMLSSTDRVIFGDEETDSALILVPTGRLPFPDAPLPLLPKNTPLPIGAEVGWLGFPAVVAQSLCFFAGNISARQESRHAYLIDGVAINGVSGGPVLYSTATEGIQIVGTITAYVANRATGDTLPGLSFAQDVSHLHEMTQRIKSIDEALAKKHLQDQIQHAPADATGKPPSA